MNKCKDRITDTCGKKMNSKCVDYDGDLSAATAIEDCSDPSVEDVIEDINTSLDSINTGLDLSGLGNACITYTETGDVVLAKDAFLAMEERICELTTYIGLPVAGCTDCTPCSPIFDEDIACLDLDLGDLVDTCGTQPTTFKELLQVILTKINE